MFIAEHHAEGPTANVVAFPVKGSWVEGDVEELKPGRTSAHLTGVWPGLFWREQG